MKLVDLPLSRKAIVLVKSPIIHSKLLLETGISVTLILVAFEGPLLVIIIVKVIISPIVTSSESTSLTTVKLTRGFTFTLAFAFTAVLFCLQVTFTTFTKVPFVIAFKVKVNTYD